MYEELKPIGIPINKETEALLNAYSKMFLKYNSMVNLIGKNDEKFLFEKHIYDSLAINLFIKKYIILNNINLLDIGTGGGFPSVPVALFFNNINVTAVDSVNKKINFIKSVKESFSLSNLNPICIRIENLPDKNSFDVVTSRAMAELRVILEYAIPFVKTGGYFIAYKSVKSDEEINSAQNALKTLNSKIIDKIEYSLPIDEANKRVLIVIKKEKDTPEIYPRNNSLIKKKPL